MRKGARQLSVGLIVTACVAGTGACDTQAPSNYRGEPLLTLQGSIDLSHVTLSEPFVPALLFSGGNSEHKTLMDVGFTGAFPSTFTLEIYEPPPERFLAQNSGEDDPRTAFASVVIVPADHPRELHGFGWQGVQGWPPCEVPGPCELTYQWCTAEMECRTATYSCPTVDAWHRAARLGEWDACQFVRSNGDPRPNDDLSTVIAGAVYGYHLVYAEEPIPERTPAAAYAGYAALDAGYNLIRTEWFIETDEQQRTRVDCERHAETLAADHYNAAYGTSLTLDELWGGACMGQLVCAHGTEDFWLWWTRSIAELACPFHDHTTRRISDPESEMLRLVVNANAPVVMPPRP